MKTKFYMTILAALTLATGITSCKSDEENSARPSKETLIVEGGNTQIVMKAGDEMMTLNINADCAWTVENLLDDEFDGNLFVQPMRGYGNGTLVVTTNQNTGVTGRTASFILKTDGGLQQKVTIQQTSGDPTMNISARSLEYAAIPASAQALTISSNNAWTATLPAGVSWVHLDKTSGTTGTTVVNITADEIQDDVARSAFITVVYGSSSAQVKILQQPKTNIFLSVDRNELFFNTNEWNDDPNIPEWEKEHWEHEQYQMVNVTSNANWKVYVPSSASSWVWAEPSQGTGNGEFRVMCSPWSQQAGNRLTSVIVVAGTQNPKQCDILVQQQTNGGDEPYGPEPGYSLTVGDLTSMYVSDISADFRFSFVCTQSVGEYGLVYSMDNNYPTLNDSEKVVKGQGAASGTVLVALEDLHPNHTYYVRAYVMGNNGTQYSPNVVTIKTSSSGLEPGESDNPDPTLAPRR